MEIGLTGDHGMDANQTVPEEEFVSELVTTHFLVEEELLALVQDFNKNTAALRIANQVSNNQI